MGDDPGTEEALLSQGRQLDCFGTHREQQGMWNISLHHFRLANFIIFKTGLAIAKYFYLILKVEQLLLQGVYGFGHKKTGC